MFIVHVFVHVEKDYIEDFKQATVENARQSLTEPGITRFDIVQQQDDPSKFVLVEVYRTYAAPARHKETEHYQRWRGEVAHMMAEPRTSIKFNNVFPIDEGWE